MEIRKQYKFYAAHRNEELEGKCQNIHGHTYRVALFFENSIGENGNIGVLFEDFDEVFEPYFKIYDHSMLINRKDPLCECLEKFKSETGSSLKMVVFNRPTSVENLAHRIMNFCSYIKNKRIKVNKIEIQETDSSTVVYSKEDWIARGGRNFLV